MGVIEGDALVTVAEADSVFDGDAVMDCVSVALYVADSLAELDAVSVTDSVTVSVTDSLADSVTVSVTDSDALYEAVLEGVKVLDVE